MNGINLGLGCGNVMDADGTGLVCLANLGGGICTDLVHNILPSYFVGKVVFYIPFSSNLLKLIEKAIYIYTNCSDKTRWQTLCTRYVQQWTSFGWYHGDGDDDSLL